MTEQSYGQFSLMGIAPELAGRLIGGLGQARDARHFLHSDGADSRHEGERLLEFLEVLRRERDVMSVAANRAVVMVTRDGVEDPPPRSDAPETASRWFRSRKLLHSGRRGVSERDSDRPPPKAKCLGQAPVYTPIVSHPGFAFCAACSAVHGLPGEV